jgi:ParB family chromosome partitioning protein
MKKQALGRGLGALISTTDPAVTAGSSIFNEISISHIYPNPNQPRRDFNDELLEELAASIRTNGIITPITLRKVDEDRYEIIAGERRYRASKLAGLEKIPAYIRIAKDDEVMEMALIENIQREDLNAIEIALGYNNLVGTYNLTQEELSERVGKKRATIANYIRLLKLPAEVQMGIKDKKIDMGHARALAGIEDPTELLGVYEQILKEEASVRRSEEIVRELANKKSKATGNTKKEKAQTMLPQEYDDLKNELRSMFKSKVQLTYNDKGKGKITIPFSNDEDLMRLMTLFDNIKR